MSLASFTLPTGEKIELSDDGLFVGDADSKASHIINHLYGRTSKRFPWSSGMGVPYMSAAKMACKAFRGTNLSIKEPEAAPESTEVVH